MDKSDTLEHVGNIIQPTNLGLQALFIHSLVFVGDLARSFFKTDDLFPGDKEGDELLAENSQRFLLLVLGGRPFAVATLNSVLYSHCRLLVVKAHTGNLLLFIFGGWYFDQSVSRLILFLFLFKAR